MIQTSFVGDCVLTLPLIARTFEQVARAEIHVITTPVGAALFEVAKKRGLKAYAASFHIHIYDKKNIHRPFFAGLKFIFDLKKRYGSPEVVFCAQRSLRSGLLGIFSGAPVRVGFSSGAASYCYTQAVQREWDTGKSEIEKNLDLLRAWVGAEKVLPWDPVTAPSLLSNLNVDSFASPNSPVLLSLGSPWPTKRWTLENASQMTRELVQRGHAVHLIGDDDSVSLAQELQSDVSSPLLVNVCGQTSIEEWVDRVASAKVLVSGDSAAVHVASDLKVPVLALFGPTSPEFGFAPWRKGSLALSVKNLPCRPCHIHGPQVCPLGHHECMKNLKPERVLRFLQRYLEA
jgi:heptosyltransferase-2